LAIFVHWTAFKQALDVFQGFYVVAQITNVAILFCAGLYLITV